MKLAFTQIKQSKSGKPSMIIAKTVKGKGIAGLEGKFESHYHSIDQTTKNAILTEMK